MLENYLFDESNKRFKPISKTCCYCGNKVDGDFDTNFYIKVFKTSKRHNLIVYRDVEYSSIEIGIPRCLSCMKIHKKIEMRSILIFIGVQFLLILSMIFGYYNKDVFPIILFVLFASIVLISFMVFVFADLKIKNFLLIKYLQKKIIKKTGIPTERDGARKDKTIKSFFEIGWAIDRPLP